MSYFTLVLIFWCMLSLIVAQIIAIVSLWNSLSKSEQKYQEILLENIELKKQLEKPKKMIKYG